MIDVVCYYYEPVKAPLLRQAILPAIESLAGVVVQLERHWSHGPHVRIRLDGPRPWVRNAAVMLVRRLRSHLSASPSTGSYTALPSDTPLYADNTVRVEPTDTTALAGVLGSAAAVQCQSAVLRQGLPAVSASVRWLGGTGDTSQARTQLAVAAMAAHAGRYPLGLVGAYQPYLSHVEEFLRTQDAPARIRAGFERSWNRHAAEATTLVARVAGGEPADAAESAWRDWTVRARTTADPFYDRAAIPRRPDSGGKREPAVHGFTTDMLYSLLALCDVTPVERYRAAYLVYRACERVTGTHR